MQNTNLYNLFTVKETIAINKAHAKFYLNKLNGVGDKIYRIGNNKHSFNYNKVTPNEHYSYKVQYIYKALSKLLFIPNLKRDKEFFYFGENSKMSFNKFDYRTINFREPVKSKCECCDNIVPVNDGLGVQFDQTNHRISLPYKSKENYKDLTDCYKLLMSSKGLVTNILRNRSKSDILRIALHGFNDSDIEKAKALKEKCEHSLSQITPAEKLARRFEENFRKDVIDYTFSVHNEKLNEFSSNLIHAQELFEKIEKLYDNELGKLIKKPSFYNNLLKVITDNIKKNERCLDGIDFETLSLYFDVIERKVEVSVSSHSFCGETDHYSPVISFDDFK